jgi:glycolate oxidase FAD binding subunit
MDSALQSLGERIHAATEAATPLVIRAGGTKDFYGNPTAGELLDPRGYRGIVAYEPTELVITARCGTPLAELEAVLSERGQCLPFEPPHFGAGATVGGCIAAGLAGPRRAGAGAVAGSVRDFVLGAKLIDGRGQLLAFGGTVMKNVAGYDMARTLAGSLGTLGLIVEASIKVLPQPPSQATLRFELPQAAALRQMNLWAGQPLPISATLWHDGLLHLRLAGARAAIDAACNALGGARVEEAEAAPLWQSVREQTHAFFGRVTGVESLPSPGAARQPLAAGEGFLSSPPGTGAGVSQDRGAAKPTLENGPALWRLSLPSTAAVIDTPEPQLIEWGGALRWLRSERPAAELRALAASAGGHATLFRRGGRTAGAFQPLAPPLAAIHRRLKAEFDPAGIFNRGRMYADL